MIYLLVALLSIFQIAIYFLNGKKIISPSFLSNLMFLLSSLTYMLYKDSFYGEDISITTILIIIACVFFILFGELASRKVLVFKLKPLKTDVNRVYSVPKWFVIVATLFTFISSGLYFLDVYKYSIMLGNSVGNFFGMAEIVRRDNTYTTPSFINILNVITECAVYFFIYVFTSNYIFNKVKKLIHLLPCLGYLIYIFACHSRGNIIKNICIICIIIFCIISQNESWSSNGNKRILKIGIISVILFIIVFRILGYRTKTSNNLNLTLNIVDYVSSGIFGLNKYLSEPIQHSELFGEKTFKLIYIKLNDLGFNFQTGSQFEPFFDFKMYKSNIYTGLKMLIDDFGYLGSGVFLFIYSFAISDLFKRIKLWGCTFFKTALLGILFYPIVMISIGGVWSDVFGVTTIYMMIILFITSYLSNRKFGSDKKRKDVKKIKCTM